MIIIPSNLSNILLIFKRTSHQNAPPVPYKHNEHTYMTKRAETMGDLLGSYQKVEFDRSSQVSMASKLEHIDEEAMFSMGDSQVKTQAKLQYEYGIKTEDQQQIIIPKSRQVSQLLTIRQSDRPRDVMRIKLDFLQPPARKQRPQLQFQRFRHEDVWDPTRQLRCKISSQNIFISNMVELPAEKHKLNEPRPYKQLEPMKKKMYRPAVPRVFHSGFDTFLDRRKKNGGGGEIDLGVWNVDEVLQECYKKDIIPLAIYNQFINTNGHLQIRRFLQAWQGGELPIFDFHRTNFTLLDHRRLSELLLYCFPEHYTRGSIDALHPDVKEFIAASYRLSSDDYAQSYLLLDQISECTWWGDLKTRLESDPDHAAYFRLKESINKQPLPSEMQYDKHSKSQYIRDLLGPIRIADSQAELQKILSMKYKNNKGERINDDSGSSYHRNEQDEDFEQSHDPTQLQSQQSVQGHKQKSKSGPDWFEED